MDSYKSVIWDFSHIRLPFFGRRILGHFIDLTRPDFLIIGAQRGGTTSLFHYLQTHPHIRLPITKEIHYFDLQSYHTPNWYFSHFPLSQDFTTGEASPYYLFHPEVPERVAHLLPQVRLIVLLRDPVTRAYSHYQHNRSLNLETRSFSDAISTELKAIESRTPFTINTPYAHRHFTYISRGIYIEQLKRWLRFFPPEQLLYLNSTDLFTSPQRIVMQVIQFLQLDADKLPQGQFLQYNQSKFDEQTTTMPHTIKTELINFYFPFNQQLAHQFNFDLSGWTGHEDI